MGNHKNDKIQSYLEEGMVALLPSYEDSSGVWGVPVASLTFDQNAISTLAGEAGEDIKITTAVVENHTLSKEMRQKIGDRPGRYLLYSVFGRGEKT